MVLIGFLAKKRHGKNTAGDYLVKNCNFTEMAFASQLKEGIKAIYGLNDDQLYGDKKETVDKFWNESARTIMQWLGTDVFRKKDKNFWVKTLERKYINFIVSQQQNTNKTKTNQINVVVTDVRFQNEIDFIHKYGGKVIKIYRESINDKSTHIAENGIDDIKDYDFLINNNGTIEDLHNNIEKIMIAISVNKSK